MNINKIQKTIENELSGRHSFFQLEYFIIKSEPSHQAQLHQCLVEMQSRLKTIKHVQMEIEEMYDRIELFKLEEVSYDSAKEREIKKRMQARKLTGMEDRLDELNNIKKYTEEEITFISQIYESLTAKEPLKSWDNNEVQMEYFSNKCLRDIRTKTLLGYPLDQNLINTTFALPDNARAKQEVLKNIESSLKKVNNIND